MNKQKTPIFILFLLFMFIGLVQQNLYAQVAGPDLNRALKRASYLLIAQVPTEIDHQQLNDDVQNYRQITRNMLNHPNFYDSLLRYHERIFGVGLPTEYLDELMRNDIDGKEHKFAKISCERASGLGGRYRCNWKSSSGKKDKISQCPQYQEQAVETFWRPGLVAWVCPSVARACGSDLSQCFIEYANPDEAKNAELGASEIFDSRFSVVKSLARQAAGIATAIAIEEYPYTKIMEPGITAVDGAIAHFYRQQHHFDLTKVHIPNTLLEQLDAIQLTDTRFQLMYMGSSSAFAGVLSTFGYLRRFEKNRTRANQLYERLLCRKFTAELPRVFPQDPGNLRNTPGCMGCHATLDPLADFFSLWGEGGSLYQTLGTPAQGQFIGKSGYGLYDLANIIRNDEAFATCQVQHAWEWLIGRKFYKNEEQLRDEISRYFINTNYNFKELVYAIATHPVFLSHARSDAVVNDPLEAPALGKVPEQSFKAKCEPNVSFTQDISPYISACTNCHQNNSSRKPLLNETDWRTWGATAVSMMASGSMPPGQVGPPVSGNIWKLKEAVRCWLEQNP